VAAFLTDLKIVKYFYKMRLAEKKNLNLSV